MAACGYAWSIQPPPPPEQYSSTPSKGYGLRAGASHQQLSRHALSKADDDLEDIESVGSENDSEHGDNHHVIYSDSHSEEDFVIVSRIDI